MRLPDGRHIGYRDVGDPHGQPLFFLHGLPGSRFQCPDEGLRERGIRLIAPERPGFGLSDPVPGPYSLAAAARDVGAVADALGLQRFSVAGFSLGGMHALCCAHELPQRVKQLLLVSSGAPLDVPGNWEGWGDLRYFYELARTDPAALRRAVEPALGSAETFLAALAESACALDRRLYTTSSVRDRFLRDAGETLHGSAVDMAVRELTSCANPWGFKVSDIRAPALLWHGLDDITTPPAMGRYLAATLPDCRARFYSGEGHLLLFTRWPEILGAFAGA